MGEEKTKGIILKATPYQDNHHILSVFTEKRGVIRLFVRGTQRARKVSHALCTPLILGEWIYRKKEDGLSSLKEGHVIEPFFRLRQNYEPLKVAGQMAGKLLETLWPEKPAPSLFALFSHYLNALQTTDFPKTLWVSFLCKLHKHEGQWVAPFKCSACQKFLDEGGIKGGEAFCPTCFSGDETLFNREEKKWLIHLTEGRKILEMERPLPLGFKEKIEELFRKV